MRKIGTLALAAVLALLALVAPPAAADQLLLTGVSGNVSTTPPAGLVLTFRGHVLTNSGSTAYTYLNEAIGTASADRIVVTAFSCNSTTNQSINNTTTPVTIGLVTATQVVSNAPATRVTELWFAPVPTGTTATIVVTIAAAGSMNRCSVDWWTITGTTQTTYSSRSGASVTSVTGTSMTINGSPMTVPAGGAAIAVAVNGSTVNTVVWSQTSGSGTTETNAIQGATYLLSTYDTATAGSQTFLATDSAATSQNWKGAALTWAP